MNLTKEEAKVVNAPMIAESPVNIECKVTEVKELGSHHMFLAEVVNVNVEDGLMDENGKVHLSKSNPLVYSHGGYYETGKEIGSFGYSVRKKKRKKKKRKGTS